MRISEWQFSHAIKLARLNPQSLSTQAAKLVLVNGRKQTDAAHLLGISQPAVSIACKRINEAIRLARQAI